MGEIGICVNILGLNEGLWSVDDLDGLGIVDRGWIRTPVQGSLNMLDRLNSLPSTLKVMVTLNNECDEVRGDWSGWEGAIATIRDQFGGRVKAIACGNELDRFDDTPASFSANLVHRALPLLKDTEIKTIATSVTSKNWVPYLTALVAACGENRPDYYDVHLYGKRFADVPHDASTGPMLESIGTARSLIGTVPLALSEAGSKIGEVRGPEGQALWVDRWDRMVRAAPENEIVVGTLFALYDEVGTDEEQGDKAFGLISHQNLGRERRLAYDAFRKSRL